MIRKKPAPHLMRGGYWFSERSCSNNKLRRGHLVHRGLDGGEPLIDLLAHVRMREHVERVLGDRGKHAGRDIRGIEPRLDGPCDLGDHLAGRTCRIERPRLAIARLAVASALADASAHVARAEHADPDAMWLELDREPFRHRDHGEFWSQCKG